MNTNFLHNIINMLIAAVPALSLFDWTPFFSEGTSLKIVGLLGLVKILINAWRDGPSGMVRPQPPVRGN
ncbi:hypothetical protein NAC44_15765 [Allorhizobium sp. BGMRC 0089]|uniref:hypothetical protein n=1 Tax=Allorhizobium sonneratiae TaxID=2934936 RepID=UPI0020334A63|nr:hypothetical protein [Allorhizobium sonneratiae]MCM2293784.1 hypothetical protein [Allorhizobium sonneratiae]